MGKQWFEWKSKTKVYSDYCDVPQKQQITKLEKPESSNVWIFALNHLKK